MQPDGIKVLTAKSLRIIAYPEIWAVIEDKETAASAVEPSRPTENTDATVSEYCKRNVTTSGKE